MPEAAIHKDNHLGEREKEVRVPQESAGPEPPTSDACANQS